MTVLTEANLRNLLTDETTKLNIEHHYWLKDAFLCKLGRLAPKLQILNLKRLAISNQSFIDIFRYCTEVKDLDISECPYIEESGSKQYFESCSKVVTKFVANNS